MAQRQTIEQWGAHLNVEGEPLTIEQAMLLQLGHLNARLQQTLDAMIDVRVRLTRIELYLQETVPDYERVTRRAALAALNPQDRAKNTG